METIVSSNGLIHDTALPIRFEAKTANLFHDNELWTTCMHLWLRKKREMCTINFFMGIYKSNSRGRVDETHG